MAPIPLHKPRIVRIGIHLEQFLMQIQARVRQPVDMNRRQTQYVPSGRDLHDIRGPAEPGIRRVAEQRGLEDAGLEIDQGRAARQRDSELPAVVNAITRARTPWSLSPCLALLLSKQQANSQLRALAEPEHRHPGPGGAEGIVGGHGVAEGRVDGLDRLLVVERFVRRQPAQPALEGPVRGVHRDHVRPRRRRVRRLRVGEPEAGLQAAREHAALRAEDARVRAAAV